MITNFGFKKIIAFKEFVYWVLFEVGLYLWMRCGEGGGGVITEAYTKCYKFLKSFDLNPIPPGLFEGGSAWKRRGGGGEESARGL